MNKQALLNRLYEDINDIIIKKQHPVTGLLPASTAITLHGDYTDAWVRDNVYSILGVWSLSMAYRRNGEQVRCDELEQSTIKLMRGLLQSMMRQAPKVEKFKHTLDPMDCLHAKYNTTTGLNVVEDHEWGHLQIDATSIFLLMIAQMSASGLRIVNTLDEVDFIQNLIYYIAFAYRTPDYGIWERGNKINNGKTEINASSVGMAKAALQALDGLNLFGKNANPKAIVHTIPDGISRARNILTNLLPRESISKEVDSAILSIIGFPAFAVSDTELVDKTKNKILSELGGNFGCKRFLWDGHQTAIEDHSRMYYEHSELASFENIESEWPLFYTYLYIQALFDDDAELAKTYRDKLESVMVESDGKHLLPELYYVAKENIDEERKNPGSQPRQPNENIPLVWAQSLYFTGLMLDEGLLEKDDLDPLKLRSRSSKSIDAQLAMVVLAENDAVKQQLAEKGVIAETLKEIHPIKVISAAELVETYRQVGANERLNLTGRPKRRFQGLATAQTYKINNAPYLSLSSLQFAENNYRVFDAELSSRILTRELEYICRNWISDEVAVFTFLVSQDVCDAVNVDILLDTIRRYQLRSENVNVGYASAHLAYRASRVNELIFPPRNIEAITSENMISNIRTFDLDVDLLSEEFREKLNIFHLNDEDGYHQIEEWLTHYGLDDDLSNNTAHSLTLRDVITQIYYLALKKQFWLTGRYCFSLLGFTHKHIADDVSLLCASTISTVVGKNNQLTLTEDHSLLKPRELHALIDAAIDHPLERTLVQELLVILGNTIRTNSRVFNGLRSIKIINLLSLCAQHNECNKETLEELAFKSPHEFYELVQDILKVQKQAFDHDVNFSFSEQMLEQSLSSEKNAIDIDWLKWRSARGLITRFDDEFLTDIWNSLANTNAIIFADHCHAPERLNAAETRSSMTPREESFARQIDTLIQHMHPVYYKSAIMEVLYVYSQLCIKKPDQQFADIALGEILKDAADLFIAQQSGPKKEEDSNLINFMYLPPQEVQKYLDQVFGSGKYYR